MQVPQMLRIPKERRSRTVTFASIPPKTVESDLADHQDLRYDPRRLKRDHGTAICGCDSRSETSVYLQWPVLLSRKRTTTHESHCRHAAWEVAVTDVNIRLSLCSLALKRRLHLSMVLSYPKWSELQIKPELKIRRVVSASSPAFQLLNRLSFHGLNADDCIYLSKRAAGELLRLFQERKATPYDRLEDGSTLLHVSRRTPTFLERPTET